MTEENSSEQKNKIEISYHKKIFMYDAEFTCKNPLTIQELYSNPREHKFNLNSFDELLNVIMQFDIFFNIPFYGDTQLYFDKEDANNIPKYEKKVIESLVKRLDKNEAKIISLSNRIRNIQNFVSQA